MFLLEELICLPYIFEVITVLLLYVQEHVYSWKIDVVKGILH